MRIQEPESRREESQREFTTHQRSGNNFMRRPTKRWYLVKIIFLLFIVLLVPSHGIYAADTEGSGFGWRAGFYDGKNDEKYRQYDMFLNVPLPWTWFWSSGWWAVTHLDFAAGALRAAQETGGVFSLGPGFILGKEGGRMRYGFGVSPTYLTKSEFGTSDLGGRFHLTSHHSIGYQISPKIVFSYRAQHISNAQIRNQNPGLNTHFVEIRIGL